MNLTHTASLTIVALALSVTAGAATPIPNTRTHDADLSPPSRRIVAPPPTVMAPDTIESVPGTGDLTIEAVREDHGRMTPVANLQITNGTGATALKAMTDSTGKATIKACDTPTGRATYAAELNNAQFSVTNGRQAYKISFESACRGTTRIIFREATDVGQAIGIWQVASRAREKLQASIGLTFWRSQIDFVWPADGDYYSFGTVHITKGNQWDVVGHEMGHAIYDLGALGTFGGGEHYIDRCYSTAMALSEGWASYFSAFVSIDMGDTDAKFEYLVPRRAPIRFENIPADVCAGEMNEWRVTGFFWDLIDLHADGESVQETFARVWAAMAGSRVGSASAALARLDRAGFSRETSRMVWTLNFLSQPTP